MNDPVLRQLAIAAGIEIDWTDNEDRPQVVSEETARRILAALGLGCESVAQARESLARLRFEAQEQAAPLTVTRVRRGAHIRGPGLAGRRACVALESGGRIEFTAQAAADGRIEIPPIAEAGYHRIEIAGSVFDIAVAPHRCFAIGDIVRDDRAFGLTAQIYGLRRATSGLDADMMSLRGMGSGDFGALADLACAAARFGADAIGMSPAHALFASDINHYWPYSPSNRQFLNIWLTDPAATFDAQRIGEAMMRAGLGERGLALEDAALVDWPQTAAARLALMRALFELFTTREMASQDNALAQDFAHFRAAGGPALAAHAQFEALHAREFARDFTKWSWRDWEPQWRTPGSRALQDHWREAALDISFHIFAQWLATRALALAQRSALEAGMRIGLIGDLAIGLNPGGSHAWARQDDLLEGLSIGAPPDALGPRGQDWGVAAFSPRALWLQGYQPFVETLRANMRHCGGLRIDHAMGLARLWLVPAGMNAADGAYLRYRLDDLLALTALESSRQRAIVIGEDLGTTPHGFRERLAEHAIAGLRVMLFERDGRNWRLPESYARDAVAMTTTHDTATMSGWWSGLDIEWREACGQLAAGATRATAHAARDEERANLNRAFVAADCALPDHDARPCDSAVAFIAKTAAQLALAPIEDVAALADQPNLPGTTFEYPNWRRRYPAPAPALFNDPAVRARLMHLQRRRRVSDRLGQSASEP